jgi:predicted short-subunit dehydrogenase-like oxidoreductase (DUF2520 family)
MAALMQKAGAAIRSLSGGSPAGAEAARRVLKSGLPWTPGCPVLTAGTMIIIGVPDDALAAVASELARGPLPAGGVAIHLSGIHDRAVLAPLRSRGLRTGSFHPLRAFPSRQPPGPDLGGSLVAVEAEEPECAQLFDLARRLGGEPLAIGAEGRALYHLGAALAGGLVLGVWDMAVRAATAAGIPEEAARRGLANIIHATLANAERMGAAEALAGPVVRGDVETLTRHLAAIETAFPERRSLYLELLRALCDLCERRGASEKTGRVRAWLLEQRS